MGMEWNKRALRRGRRHCLVGWMLCGTRRKNEKGCKGGPSTRSPIRRVAGVSAVTNPNAKKERAVDDIGWSIDTWET